MDTLEKIIVLGLYQFGRKKTFGEILLESGQQVPDHLRMELASTLEASGYIQDVTYQLPVSIRARLTPSGEALARSFGAAPTAPSGLHSAIQSLLVILQVNLAFI